MLYFAFIASLTFHLSFSSKQEEIIEEGNFQFSVLRSGNSFNSSTKITRQFQTKSGYQVRIYDGVLTPIHLEILRVLSTYKLGSWSYRLPEQDVKNGQNYISQNNLPWYNELDVTKFQTIGEQLQNIVSNLVGDTSVEYHLYKATAHVVRRGDFPHIHVDARRDEDEVSIMVYLNKEWKKNNYGDLFLYDDNKEILGGVVPKYGRIVVWHSTISYLSRPPSVGCNPGQLLLHIQFTKNITKLQHTHTIWLKNRELLDNFHKNGLLTPYIKDDAIDVESHVVARAKSKNGKKIFVFDDLFSQEVLDDLRSKILNYGFYYYDDSYDEDSDNVQWIAGFDVDHYVQSNMWNITKQVATYASGGLTQWYPYDVSCNLIRNADTTQIHHDCSKNEDEWTFLLYLNPEWSPNYYGETVFFEKNSDKTDIITEVLPKYGRITIFQGIIPHSARPPSSNFSGARLSFAVKLSENEWVGRTKAIEEQNRHVGPLRAIVGAITKLKSLNNGDPKLLPTVQDIENVYDDFEPDHVLQELESKLESVTEQQNIDDLKLLTKEIRQQHHQSMDEVGNLINQML